MTRPGSSRTELVAGPAGQLEILRTGHGRPHSLFVHGLAGSIATTRPYATAVPGTRTFVHLRGHGRSALPPGPFGYADLAADVWAVADRDDADRDDGDRDDGRVDRALGVSMGAGALLNGLTRDPDRFERVVLVLPASIDRPRSDTAMASLERLGALVEAGHLAGVADHLVADQPASVRADPAVRVWAEGQAQQLLTSGVAAALRQVPSLVPVPDRALLAGITCPVLVLAQEGDATHPVEVAEELASLLPRSTLHVADADGIMWAHRVRTRELVGAFLAGQRGA